MALQGQPDARSAGGGSLPGGEFFTRVIPQSSLTGNMVSLETVTQPLSSTKAVWGNEDLR